MGNATAAIGIREMQESSVANSHDRAAALYMN